MNVATTKTIKPSSTFTLVYIIVIGLLVAACGNDEQDADPEAEAAAHADNPFLGERPVLQETLDGSDYSPYTGERIPQQLLWGDTHLHSSMSIDANSAGNEKLTPAEAYQFARGDEVTANNGKAVRLNRPLDFLVVSDHAEYLGLIPRLRTGDPSLQNSEAGRQILATLAKGREATTNLFIDLGNAFIESDNRYPSKDIAFDTWKNSSAIADEYNDPGNFTTLIGYEWTYFPQGDNLHRVVVYKDGADKAASVPPYSALDGKTPEELWAFMADYEKQTGGEVMAIPHNANVSNGLMFALKDSKGTAFSTDYTAKRLRWEPIVEVTQIKGDGETHPDLSPRDEFADFETWDKGNLNPFGSKPKTPDMLQYEYARSALKLGLGEEPRTGTNPFKFGMIGSTDAHTSLATAAENNFWGKASATEPGFERSAGIFFASETKKDELHTMSWEQVASGYAAVWALENTREEIFAALKRKEVYATTGSRMSVRFFGGWEFNEDDIDRADSARIGYSKGVPMGGDLFAINDEDKAPQFLVTAAKDPDGANLDRIQIIKGWQDDDGDLHEKVVNIAVSSDRKMGRKGSVRPVKSTVDLDTLSYTNSVGSAQLTALWEDPDFDPEERAFYYARVLEIPTPRWTEYDRKKFGFEPPKDTPREVQDRAYTSPIWYTPE
ncbi:MAG: DUF3604 domain-containing protein [Pseudomonadales bacterium]